MKNKKGVTIGRILLYVLFISLLGFFIYIIACTFKAIKDKQPHVTTQDVIKKVNSTYSYSGANYVNNAYLNFYNSSDIVYDIVSNSWSGGNPLNYNLSFSGTTPTGSIASLPTYLGAGSSAYFITPSKNDNVINIADDLNSLYTFAKSVPNNSTNYFDSFSTNYNGYRCAMLVYNCNIPVSAFNFTLSGTSFTPSTYFYIMVDNDSNYFQFQLANNDFTFNSSDLGTLGGANYITKLAFPVWNRVSNNGNGYYLTYNPYKTNYNDVISGVSNDSYSISMTFDIESEPIDGTSATQFLTDSFINVYNSSDIISDFNNGTFTTPLNTINVDYPQNPNFTYNVYSSADYFVNSEQEYSYTLKTWNCQNYVSNEVLDLRSLYYDTIDFFSLGGSSLFPASTIFPYYSTCLIINCNIPVNNFSFIAGDDFSPNFVFYVVTDYDSTIYNLTCTARRFNISDLGSDILGTSSYITQLILPISQSFVQSGLENYPVSSTLRTGINDLYSLNYKTYFKDYTGTIDFVLSFDIYQNNEGYSEGYNAGYEAALEVSNQAYSNQIASLNDTINGLESNITALNEAIANQSRTITILQDRINAYNGIDPNEFTLKNFFFAFADIPLKTAHNVLDFQFFGVNLFRFFVGVITALGMLWLIKKIV